MTRQRKEASELVGVMRRRAKENEGPAQLRCLIEANVWGGRGYLDLDLSIDFSSLLSGSSFLGSSCLESCSRFSSPSSSDLISELTEEVLWPWRPPDRAAAAGRDQQREVFMDSRKYQAVSSLSKLELHKKKLLDSQ